MGSHALFLEWIAALGAFALVLVVAAGVFRALRGEKPILFGELLHRQGPAVLRAALAPGGREFALAVRRCANCAVQGHCRAWLDSGAADGFDEFCPNSGYVARLKMRAA